MRRLPLVPTLIVTATVLTMIGLGTWQLGRAQEKSDLLALYRANSGRPALDLDPFVNGSGPGPQEMSFRRILISCWASRARYQMRGGRGRDGRPGWRYLLACHPAPEGARQGWSSRVIVDHGWSSAHDAAVAAYGGGLVAGFIGRVAPSGPIVITSASAQPPLTPSEPPSVDSIPDNHLLYAFQWFFFALAAAIIYALALRRRLSAPAQPPKGAAP